MQLGGGFILSKIVLTAVEFGLFTELGERALSGEEIGKALQLHPRGIWDFLDSLVALGLLERDGDGPHGKYRNSYAAAHYLDKSKPGYVGALLEMWNDRAYKFWGSLGEALKTGQPQNEAKQSGKPMFDVVYEDGAKVEQFSNSMAVVSRRNFEALAEKFDFAPYSTLCDVGGSNALLTRTVAKRHPHLHCTSFDLPQVERLARSAVADEALAARIDVVSGDFFQDPLPRADVITMGMILHDWNLEKKLALIRAAYDALPPGGAFIAIESLIDDARRENIAGLALSLQMMLEFGDAFDFTGADFSAWCTSVGFARVDIMHLAGASSAAIAYK